MSTGIKLRPRTNTKRIKLSLEMIDFQTDKFGSELESFFAEAMSELNTSSVKDLIKRDFDGRFNKLVYDRLGIKVKVDFDICTPGAIMIMPVSDHNVLLHKNFRSTDEIIKYNSGNKIKTEETGTIDLVNAKVSGMFSKYEHTAYIGLDVLKEMQMTPGEITGIVLHELGHAFTWYEQSARTESTNQVLQNIAGELFSKKENKNLSYVYKELTDSLKISKEEAEQIINSQNQVIMGVRLFSAVTAYTASQLETERYSETSSEQLADQFATRFGYGRQLITALEKLYKFYGSGEYNSIARAIAYLLEASIFTVAILSIVSILSGFISPPILVALFYSGLISLAIGFNSSESFKDMTYDSLKDRYLRVRKELIAMLKTNMTTEDKKLIISNISITDAAIKEIKEHKAILSYISDLLPSNRKIKDDRYYQQMLETFANNDLFLKASQFELLAQTK